ncbi:class I SAM-dependent methyltransferase [Thermomonas sp.]|uniref:class I SAM-dependent methyltransferase n=1 Tax=Thermomonas sp. TaxID=1971895 RepID=UPI0035ADE924
MPFAEGSSLLVRNIEAFGPSLLNILLIGTERGLARAVPDCQPLMDGYEGFSVTLPEPVASQSALIEAALPEGANGGNTLILLADADQLVLKALHAATGFLKARGFVVNTLYARTLFVEPVQARVNPIHYEVMFNEAGKVAANLRRGHYLEFGTFDGRTFTLAWHSMAKRCPWMRFFGFDSFTGILGARNDEVYVDGTYCSNRETFEHNWRVAGLDPGRCMSVPGDFRESLAEPGLRERLGIEAAAVVHIDCDVYEAAKAALDFVAPVLQQGSVLLFDEFHANHASNATGERRALRELLAAHPELEVERWHDYAVEGRSFLVHRHR